MTTQDQSISFRDTLMEVSRKVDTLTALLHQHIEKMLSQQEGMKRLGEKVDTLEVRTRHVELVQAEQRPQSDMSARWVERAILAAVSILVTLVTVKLTGGTVP